MSNAINWDENADFLFDTTMFMMDHLNSQSEVVKINTVLFSNPQKLLTCRESVEVVAKVFEEILTHFMGEEPPSRLIHFVRQSTNNDLKAYVSKYDIIRIWDLPIASVLNLSIGETVPTEEIGGEQAFLWEGLIDHLGDKPGIEHL